METDEQAKWIQWMRTELGPDAEFLRSRPFAGATSAEVLLTEWRCGAESEKIVLRRFTNREWLAAEPHLALQEKLALTYAAEGSAPVPALLAVDETGDLSGTPSVMMSYLPGEVYLRPQDKEEWLRELAAALTSIHQIGHVPMPYRYYTYNKIEELKAPDWSSCPDVWGGIIERLRSVKAPVHKEQFIHRDFHPVNVLWSGGKVSGIVDWVNACIGPAGIDVGHCRMNLALLFGTIEADFFLEAYRQENPLFDYELHWDMVSLIDFLNGQPRVYPGWPANGVTGLTDALMIERVDSYARSLFERLA